MSDGRTGRGSRTSTDSVVLLRATHSMSAEALLARLGGAPRDDRDIVSTGGGPLLAHLPVAADALRARASKELGSEMPHSAVIEPNRAIRRGTAAQTGGIVSPAVPLTWGLEALGISSGSPTGKGTAVAVLDGGLDFNHPDFRGRVASADVARIIDADPQDPDGHGTHCAGIVGGPAVPSWGPRYGVAPDTRLLIADIYGSGKETTDWHLLRGLFWAAERGADVASLSLRTAMRDEVEPFSELFEQAAQFLLDRYGMIIVAAAGNSSDRAEPFIGPLEHPADCPSVIAVGAVNRKLHPARFSAGGVPPQRVPAFVAPGVAVQSAYAIARSGANPPYRALTGTSESAPYAAGVAALWVEHGFRGHALVGQLLASVKPLLPFGERAVGAGLVQAPR